MSWMKLLFFFLILSSFLKSDLDLEKGLFLQTALEQKIWQPSELWKER